MQEQRFGDECPGHPPCGDRRAAEKKQSQGEERREDQNRGRACRTGRLGQFRRSCGCRGELRRLPVQASAFRLDPGGCESSRGLGGAALRAGPANDRRRLTSRHLHRGRGRRAYCGCRRGWSRSRRRRLLRRLTRSGRRRRRWRYGRRWRRTDRLRRARIRLWLHRRLRVGSRAGPGRSLRSRTRRVRSLRSGDGEPCSSEHADDRECDQASVDVERENVGRGTLPDSTAMTIDRSIRLTCAQASTVELLRRFANRKLSRQRPLNDEARPEE